MVKAINKLRRETPPPAVVEELSSTDKLLAEIRDTLQRPRQL
jgi:hypothetical protein